LKKAVCKHKTFATLPRVPKQKKAASAISRHTTAKTTQYNHR